MNKSHREVLEKRLKLLQQRIAERHPNGQAASFDEAEAAALTRVLDDHALWFKVREKDGLFLSRVRLNNLFATSSAVSPEIAVLNASQILLAQLFSEAKALSPNSGGTSGVDPQHRT